MHSNMYKGQTLPEARQKSVCRGRSFRINTRVRRIDKWLSA